ncbi:MAG: AAA family ATPase [Armatimonadetes bacterium]|nr:AAA family ATPase [Armatimonadota bacterium]
MVYQDGARLALGTGGHSVGPARFLAARGFIDPGEVAAMYGDLDVRGNAGIVEQFLHVLDPGVKGLSLVPIAGVSVVHADLGLPRKVPVAFAGGGMARLLEMAVAIGASRGGVVLIDEVENGLHHDSLPDVWRAVAQAARDCDCQVVATTHSYECVRAAHEAFSGEWAEDLTYLRLERVRGSVTARVADHATLGAALDGGLEVR